jgi:general secretion pathway protein G
MTMGGSPAGRYLKAFTLVEVMIVVVILGLLFSMVLPAFKSNVDKTKYNTSVMNLTSVAKAMEQYYLQYGKYPTFKSWSEVAAENSPLLNFITKIPATDGWGRPFTIKSTDNEYELKGQGCPNEKFKDIYQPYIIVTDMKFKKGT